jgi:hypothetical protein
MRITCCKQNGAQLHPRESATLPTAEPLCGIAHNRKIPKIYFEIIPIFGMFAKISCYE